MQEINKKWKAKMNLFSCSKQETTPLAGSSAGAIVCAVIASGASMQEALTATKVLAEDCRLRGTAFRLGVCFYSNTLVVFSELACIFSKLANS